jgi:hypothetical protein
MDVTLRVVVIFILAFLVYFFYTKKIDSYSYFAKGLEISLVASIIFFFEGVRLFEGYSDLDRLPLCLLVIGIWGVAFYFYYMHFSSYLKFSYLSKLKIFVILLIT